MKIVIIVDNPVRDLPACVLVALALSEVGHRVRLIPFDNAAQGTFAAEPDYVLVNYARVTNETFLRRLQDCGIPVGVLDTEGGVYAKPEGTETAPIVVKTFPISESVRNSLVDYFIWGKNLYDYLSVSGHFAPSALRLTGTPRTDVLHPDLSSLGQTKDLVLINTSFTLANPKFRSAEAEARDLIEKFNFNEESVLSGLAAQKKLLLEFIALTKKLALKFPEEQFVLRPHPFEGHDAYQEGLAGLPNLEMRADGSIDSWLYRSKALIHFECSTALEACLIGVPTFSILKNAQFRQVEVISEITDYCRDEEDLSTRLEDVLQGRYSVPTVIADRRGKMIEKIYFKFDGESHLRVRDAVTRSLQEARTVNRVSLKKWRCFYGLRNLVKRVVGKPIVRKPKNFTLAEVEELIRRFQNSARAIGRNARTKGLTHAVEVFSS